MAAPVTTISGVDLVLKIGGSTITQREAELFVAAELPSVASKTSANFDETINGARTWGFRLSGPYVESSAELAGRTGSISIGGTALKGWETATLSLTSEMPEIVNFSDGLDAKRNPKMRRATLSVDGYYFDPRGTGAGALDAILAEVLGTTTAGLATVLTFGSAQSVSFTARPSDVNVSAPYTDEVRNRLTLASTSAVTYTSTNAETALGALISAWKAAGVATSVSCLFATATSGASQWTGTAFVSELTVEIPYRAEVSVSATLTGSGAITPAATA